MDQTSIVVKSLADIERDKDTSTLAEQAVDIGNRAAALIVKDEATLAEAGDIRLEGQRILKQLETRRKFFVDPHNAFVKAINAFYKLPGDTITNAVAMLGSRMVAYSNEVDRKAREAEAKILADKRTTAETKSAKIAAVPEAPKVVRSETGSVSFRIDKRLKIVDALLLPREYLLPDEKFILAALKAGKSVPGAILEDVKVPVGRSAW